MDNRHILDEMKAAIRVGEGSRAEALQTEAETPDVEGAEIGFVPASAQAISQFGMETCMIIHRLPQNASRRHNILEYAQYLLREARRQGASAYYNPEKKDYILVQFPGREPDVYSEYAFVGSIQEMLKQNRSEVRENLRATLITSEKA